MTPLPEFDGTTSTPWIGDVIQDPVDEVVSFHGTDYPIRLEATADTLIWSVPENSARAAGGRSSFASGLQRFAVTRSVEAWRFPKLEQESTHEVVLLIDRELGTAVSIELALRSVATGVRPRIRILRGTLAGYPQAYGGFAFPRFKPDARRVSLDVEGVTAFLDFDSTGQPSAVGRADSRRRASGHVLRAASDAWAVAWRTTETVAVALIDENAGVVNGEILTGGPTSVMTFGLRAGVVRAN